jgi:hypothetical protein
VLRPKRTDVVVLAGAGVSMPPPTSLPSGDRLRDTCVEKLLTDATSRSAVRRLLRTASYKALLPEAVLQLMGSTVGAPLDSLMRQILRASPPSPVHRALVAMKCDLFTTNFDLCLEAAGSKRTWHLHGSIARPESLQNQLYRLGKTAIREAERFGMTVNGRVLLVVGYSLRDDDVVELIRCYPPKELFYLSFSGAIPQAIRGLACDVFVTTGSLDALFGLTPTKRPGAAPRGTPLSIPLPALRHRANALLRICSRAALHDTQLALLRKYLPQLRGRPKLLAMCEVSDSMRRAKRFGEAESLASGVTKCPCARTGPSRDAYSTALVELGLIALDRGEPDLAKIEAYFWHGLEVFEALVASEPPGKFAAENDIWRARIFNNLGLVLAARHDFPASKKMYERSLALKARHHERYGVAQTHANLAMVQISAGRVRAAASILKILAEELSEIPDAFVCNDAVCGCLSALRRAKLLPVALRKISGVPSRPERWWRIFLKRSRTGHRNIRQVLDRIHDLVCLMPGTLR